MNMQELNPLIDDLASAVQQKVGFKSMPSITLQDDEDNADVLLGKTAYYDPQNKALTVYVTNRHPKDILRSIAHELIHHGQNLRGEFDKIGAVGEGYAQNDEHLRNMEKEAYLQGNMCFRDWEDGYKRQMMESIHRQNSFRRRNTIMKKYNTSKNNDLNRLLMEKFNLGTTKESKTMKEGGVKRAMEFADHYDITPEQAQDAMILMDEESISAEEAVKKVTGVKESKKKGSKNESFRRQVRDLMEQILKIK